MAAKLFTSASVVAALRKMYDVKSWAFLEQVRGGTGAQGSRYADGIAVSLWPSRGIEIIGFEVKVSRSDWVSELKQPEKADEIFSFCDRWYLATIAGVVRDGELPKPWGLLIFDPQTHEMRMEIEAPVLTPVPLTKSFIASVCRNLGNNRPGKEELAEADSGGYRRGWSEAEKRFKKDKGLPHNDYEFERLKASVAEFEKNSGVSIEFWNGGKIGDVVAKVLKGESAIKNIEQTIPRLRSMLQQSLAQLSDHEA